MEVVPACVFCHLPKMELSVLNASVLTNSFWLRTERLVSLIALQDNIDAEVKIIVVFRCTGSATEKRIARMEQMNRVRVWSASVNPDSSSVETTTAQRPPRSATEWTIAAMDQMRRTATFHALRTNSNAIRQVVVFWERGNAMVITTAVTVLMKIRPFVTHVLATRTRSLPAKMEGVSRNHGIAIRITIAVTDPTSRLTYADRETAQLDGDAVLNGAITAVFRNGSSATAKTIAVMALMSCLNNARNATKRPNSSAKTSAAFRAAGPVILKTIAPTVMMKTMNFAATSTVNVPPRNSAALRMENAFRAVTVAITTATVLMDRMRSDAKVSLAQMEHSSARVVIASLNNSAAMENGTATWMPPTKRTVHLVFQMENTVHPNVSNATITCVLMSRIAATASTIAVTIRTRNRKNALINAAVAIGSSATTVGAFCVGRFATATTTARTARTKIT